MPAYIVPGETFSATPPNNAVTSARLNNHVAGLTILPAFVTTQPTLSPLGADKIICVQGAAFNAATITDILNLQLKDTVNTTASMRTLGTTATTAAQGDKVPYLLLSNTFTGTSNKFKHLAGTAGVTIVADAGAGVGATATLSSGATDIQGEITLTPAGTPTAATSQCTITFGVVYQNAPGITLVPKAANAWVVQSTSGKQVDTTATTSSFSLISGSTALTPGTALKFRYFIIGV